MALVAGTGAAQVVSFAAAPVLTRLYSPVEYGLLGVFLSIIGSLGALSCLRYDQAIPLPEEKEDALQLFYICLGVASITLAACGLSVVYFPDELLSLLKAPGFAPYLWLIPLGVVTISLQRLLEFWAIRELAFRALAKSKVTQTLVLVCVQIVAGTMTAGAIGLMFGQLCGICAGFSLLWYTLWRGKPRSPISRASMRRIAFRYRKFPLVSTWSGLFKVASIHLPMLLIAGSFGVVAAGFYGLCQRVVGLPMALFSDSISKVFLAEAAKAKFIRGALKRLVYQTLLIQSVLGALVVTPLFLVGPYLFGFVFGDRWIEAGYYAKSLSFMYFFQLAISPLDSLFDVLEKQEYQLIRDILRSGILVAGLLWAIHLSVSARSAMLFLGLAGGLAYFAGFLISIWCLREHDHGFVNSSPEDAKNPG